MIVSLKDRFGEFILSSEDGKALGAELLSALQRDEGVELDFIGVRSIVSAFLNPAVGDLYGQLPVEVVDRLVRFTHQNDVQRETIEAVREQARCYYTDPDYRLRQDEALLDLFR